MTALTPQNLSTRFHDGLGVKFELNARGDIVSTRILVPENPFSSLDQLLNLPSKESNRVFDVFYHLLLNESSETRGTYLSLKSSPDQYDLLKKSGTYKLPDWVNFSDDYALAKDWSDALRQCGFKASTLRGVLSTLSGILLLGNRDPNDIAEGASLIGIDPKTQSRYAPRELIVSSYIALVKNVVSELNAFLAKLDKPNDNNENEVVSVVTIAECADDHRKDVLRNVFDNSIGINQELFDDGLSIPKSPVAVTRAIQKMSTQTTNNSVTRTVAMIPNFEDILDSSLSYLSSRKPSISPDEEESAFEIADLIARNRIWVALNLTSCGDAAGLAADRWSSSVVSAQVREFFVTEWAQKRRQIDFTADFEPYEFIERYSALLPPNITFSDLEHWAIHDKRWGHNDFAKGSKRIWISESVWRDLELGLDGLSGNSPYVNDSTDTFGQSYPSDEYVASNPFDQTERLLPMQNVDHGYNNGSHDMTGYNKELNRAPQYQQTPGGDMDPSDDELDDADFDNDYGLKERGGDIEHNTAGRITKIEKMTTERRVWVFFVWLFTFWIPSPFLKYIMRMKRPEIRMAWREKLLLCFIIFLINAGIIFYMIFLGKFVCSDYDKVWNSKEIATHQGENDFYVSIHGNVYDLTKFYKIQHSDSSIQTTPSRMLEFAGQDLSDYFPPPLTVACPALVTDVSISLSYNETKSPISSGLHNSGAYLVPANNTALHKYTWYNSVFQPKIKNYYKGRVVAKRNDLLKTAQANNQYTFILNNQIYDVTNYFLTTAIYPDNDPVTKPWNFFSDTVVNMFVNGQGQDITEQFNGDQLDALTRQNTLQCLNNAFRAGEVDFRDSVRCQVANVILLVFAGILTSVTLVKFLASIRFGSKRVPSPQDKFVLCQIPIYTESETDFRLAVDSLTNLKYDNRRKLLLLVCDGMIVGAGNDKPTPNIVLDMLGVDERVNPPALAYESIGEGANQLNFAKVYSGLYENEGNVVPFIVVVKVGRPQETSKPGNRGKRDSQIMIMRFLNKVHYQKPMSPLELELFHHMTNIIGVDPELYEYIFMVDADTSVAEDSLTRLVSACANDSRIAGICGETGLQNEEKSWTTMIQVYEYFISHHLTKQFESLFGSVTCLPGCFSLYRLKTAKKYAPLFISNEVIRDYSIINVDTLHKKNLFSLGEDRYLTTLMSKYFPKMKYSFIPDAYCQTAAPEDFSVLLSQRRRWINSTVHNLMELLRLNTMCGFGFFSMRGVVFIDLIG
ncbi:chitin synthase CHS3 [Sugiyamaella lignohabitans]|uniref:chitin synthase n=1 Tax=Sugiyamaella lignohabitans TaxID=796027 RepID=A0A167CJS4_9ASCO|nr:chitin synthase CHS3 [Sugiyamaella lignohabitans]ANB11792.1 chitin synthase CHS3 [Sugiyamaella lignohabitans]